jgi:hypothetical protein
MCDCDHEHPSVGHQERPTARKRHKCCECRGWIEPGETYTKTWGVWEGDAQTFKQCRDCIDLVVWAEKDGGDVCPSFGDLHQAVLDYTNDSGDAAWYAEAKERIAAIRAKRRDPVAA